VRTLVNYIITKLTQCLLACNYSACPSKGDEAAITSSSNVTKPKVSKTPAQASATESTSAKSHTGTSRDTVDQNDVVFIQESSSKIGSVEQTERRGKRERKLQKYVAGKRQKQADGKLHATRSEESPKVKDKERDPKGQSENTIEPHDTNWSNVTKPKLSKTPAQVSAEESISANSHTGTSRDTADQNDVDTIQEISSKVGSAEQTDVMKQKLACNDSAGPSKGDEAINTSSSNVTKPKVSKTPAQVSAEESMSANSHTGTSRGTADQNEIVFIQEISSKVGSAEQTDVMMGQESMAGKRQKQADGKLHATRSEESPTVKDKEREPKGQSENTIEPHDAWNIVFYKMKIMGWRYQKGAGLLSWLWVKPDRKVKEGKIDVDFFSGGEEDLQEYAKKEYGWKGEIPAAESIDNSKPSSNNLDNSPKPSSKPMKKAARKGPKSTKKAQRPASIIKSENKPRPKGENNLDNSPKSSSKPKKKKAARKEPKSTQKIQRPASIIKSENKPRTRCHPWDSDNKKGGPTSMDVLMKWLKKDDRAARYFSMKGHCTTPETQKHMIAKISTKISNKVGELY